MYVCIMPKTLWKVINTYAQLACELHVRSRNLCVIKCYIMQIGPVINILIVNHNAS